MRIYKLANPENPDLSRARSLVWAAIASSPRNAVCVQFKYKRRWYRCRALLNTGLIFTYRSSGKVVPQEREAELLRFLVSEDT